MMQIRTRLTILFTLVTAAIVLAFALIIYYSAKKSRESEFYTVLKKEAVTKANLFFNANVAAKTLQDIYHNNRKILDEVEVAIYDSTFTLLYHDATDIDLVKETNSMIDEIYRLGELQFDQQGRQVIGLRYTYQFKNYAITATAYDQYGYNKLNSLFWNCITVFFIAILFIYIAGLFFSKRAFDPIKKMTGQAKTISASGLDLRLDTHGSRDELTELAITFNDMLSRLEKSFDAQKQFVSNISHELRTPLAAIITELELAVNRNRNREEYRTAIHNALNDSRKLARLSTSLLDLAKASYDPSEIAFRHVRLDEVLLDARQQVQLANPGYHISIHFEHPFESDDEISINGNAYLLKTAFANLFENGCKFSGNHRCTVSIAFDSDKTVLKFFDNGVGIAHDDLDNIFSPFYRGKNREFAEGNGIGLPLTQKIIHLHNGRISVQSNESQGATFTVELPRG